MYDLRTPSLVVVGSINSEKVLSAFTGLRTIFVTFPRAAEELPTRVSSVEKSRVFVGSKNNLLIPEKAPVALTVAVAPVLEPVTVSPTVKVYAVS